MFSKLTGFVHPGGDSHQPEPQEEQSLTTILSTHEDRTQYLLLVTNSMESMRNQILDTFNPEKTGGERSMRLQAPPNSDADEMVNAEKLQQTSESIDAGDDSDSPESKKLIEDIHKDRERRIKELSDPTMMSLKQAAVTHFDTWRDRVIQRIGEAINHRPDTAKTTTQAKGEHGPTQTNKQSHAGSDASTALHRQYPPQATSLVNLEQPQRILIIHSTLLLLLSLESYTAESRLLMLHLTSSLSLPLNILVGDETQVAKGLLEAAKQQMNADKETKDKAESGSNSRKWKVGLGAAAGAVLIGVTGGLAAPLLAAGIGSVMGGIGLGATATAGYLGALAGSAPLVGVLFGAYGGRMTGQMVDKYAKEVEDFAFIPVHKPSMLKGKQNDGNARHLRVAIGISGWLTEEAEVVLPWQVIGSSIEAFALRWELKALLNLGNSLTTYIKSYAWNWAKKEIISRTIFAALSSALAAALALPYGVAKAAKVVDNPFSLARSRSDKAGKVLADALINKVQGERPVTLLGYSLGARVIFSCLNELADRNAFGLIESVVLIGAATPSDSVPWRKIRSVVAGRVINVYSTNDYLLGFLYRSSSLQLGVAGLQAIRDVQNIENVDVSELVDGHLQYRFLIGSILQKVGLEDIDDEAVAKQMKKLHIEEQKVKEEQRAKREAEGSKVPDNEAEEMEKEVAQKSKAAMAMDWMNQKMSGLKTSMDEGRKSFEEKSSTTAQHQHQ